MKRDIQTDRDRLKENNQTDSHQILDSGFEELLAAAKSYGARIAYICVYNRLMARKYIIMKIASVEIYPNIKQLLQKCLQNLTNTHV